MKSATLVDILPGIGTESQWLGALSMPIIDRLLIVHYQPRILETLSNILSSKIHTQVIGVADCENYFHTQIDNSVCLNWSVSNNLLHQQPTMTWTALQDLQTFALHCLLIIIVLDDLCSRDAQSIITTELDRLWKLTANGIAVLPWHDRLPHDMISNIDHRIQAVRYQLDQFQTDVYKACYWAKSSREIDSYLFPDQPINEIHSLFIGKYHGWLTKADLA